MPVLIEEKEIILEWADIERRVFKTRLSSMDRTSGTHLSGVIRYVLRKTGQINFEDRTDDMPLMVMLGMFFEEGIVTLYPNMVWQPGEQSRDNVYGNPDGLTDGVQLEEFKFTKKSYYTHRGVLILDEKLWMWQLMGYCKMMGLRLARLHVCWDCGDYRERRLPIYITYLIRFTEAELDRFWNNVILKNMAGAEAEQF